MRRWLHRLHRAAAAALIAAAALAASTADAWPQRAPRIEKLKLSEPLPSQGRLGGVSVDSAGAVYVSNFGASVWKVSPDGSVRRVSSAIRGSSGNAIDRAGRLLQASFLDNAVLRFGPEVRADTVVAEGLDGPVGIAVDADGRIYVCNCRGNSVAVADGQARVRTLVAGAPLDCPNGVTVGPDGALYVVSFNNTDVVRVEPGGAASVLTTLPGERNAHITSAGGALYVTQIEDNRVYRVGLNGAADPVAGTGGLGRGEGPALDAPLSRPNGIAATPDGRFLIVNTLVGPWRGEEPTEIELRRIGPLGPDAEPAPHRTGRHSLGNGAELERLELRVGDLTFDALAAGPADGELVLLLHGFPQTSYAFRHQIAALATAGFRAVAPDQRGYSPGARPAGVEPYAMPKLVADVLGMAAALGAERFHLVGHDWGGAVAWVTATRHPNRVRTLTVLSTPHYAALSAARAQPDSDQATRSAYVSRFAEPGAEAAFLADDAARLRSLYAGLDPAAIDRYLSALGQPDALRAALAWYAAAFGRSATAARRSATAPSPVRVPTLYIWSTEDPVFGHAAARATADHVTGPYRFEVLEGRGHWIPEEAADTVSRLLLQQLGADGAPTRASYRRARAVLDAAIEALGGGAVEGFAGLRAHYEGRSTGRGQSPRPGPPYESVPVSGRFAYEAGGRMLLEKTLVNAGGTDRSYRQMLGDDDGWNLWIARDLLSPLPASELGRLRGIPSSYVPGAMPHSLLRAADASGASLRWAGETHEGGRQIGRLSFARPDGTTLTLAIDMETGLPAAVERMTPDPRLGDVAATVRFSDYRTTNGLRIPHRLRFAVGPELTEEWRLDRIRLGAPADSVFARPAGIEAVDYIPAFRPQPVADGVWAVRLYSGPANTYNSLLVELDSTAVVIEPVLVDLLAPPVTALTRRVAHGKPIRWVVATHHHSDHIGAARGFLALGATIVTTPHGAAVTRQMVRAGPRLASGPRPPPELEPTLVEVHGRRTLGHGPRRVELYDVGPTPHAQQILIAYVPHARTLFVADLFAIPDSRVFPPASELWRALERSIHALDLDVQTIVPAHGLVGTIDDLTRAVEGDTGPPGARRDHERQHGGSDGPGGPGGAAARPLA